MNRSSPTTFGAGRGLRLAGATALLSLLLALPLAAGAIAVAGPEGTAAQGRRTVEANPTPGAVAPAIELQHGRIESVDAASRRIVLNGRAVALDPALRVVVPGRSSPGGLAWLRAGQAIRFALKAGAGEGRPIEVIFLEATP